MYIKVLPVARLACMPADKPELPLPLELTYYCNMMKFLPTILIVLPVVTMAQQKPDADTSLFYDSHFHLTNYVQEGIDVHQFLQVMKGKAGRSTLFGIPLQQQWSYGNSGNFAPTYYLA